MRVKLALATAAIAALTAVALVGSAAGGSSTVGSQRPLTSAAGTTAASTKAKASSPGAPLIVATTLYDQTNNAAPVPGGATSQDFETANDAFDSTVADDFVVPATATWTVQEVDVAGEYGSGGGPAASFNVVFYANTSNLPGAVLATRNGQTFTNGASAHITLSSPVVLTPGTYWVSVQARQDFTPTGQWFWDNRTVISNQGAAWRNPGGGFGAAACTASFGRKTTCLPTQNGPDQLFALIGTPSGDFSISDARRLEGDAGTANLTFNVSLSAPAPATTTVHFATADGTATSGADYTASSGTVTFGPGDVTKTVQVPIVGEKLSEADETLFVNLSSPSQGGIADGQATGTILDDDSFRYTTAVPSFPGFIGGATDIGNHGDDVSTTISTPFPVSFYGATATTVSVSSNGLLAVGGSAPTDFTNQCLPTAAGERLIAPFWDDQRTDTPVTAGIFTSISGSAPNRIFNIEWRTSNFATPAVLANDYTVRFSESNPNIQVLYSSTMSNSVSATIGVQRTTLGLFTQFSCNTGHLLNSTELDFNRLSAPAATTSPATGITTSTATLQASVNPVSQATTAYFEYGLTAAYGNTTATQAIGSGSVAQAVSTALAGLASGTTFHFRVVASNATGTTIGGDQSFTTPFPPRVLTVTKAGTGAGVVTSNPAGIACGATCTASFANGTSVTLTAAPASKNTFVGWSGACSGTGPCVLTLTGDTAVTARFAKPLAPPACKVPNVVGKSVAKARSAITRAHCKVGKVTGVASSAKKKGKVLGQSPKAGKKLKNGAKVNLTVGKGPKKHKK